jgi:hypothetical protein
MERIARVSSLFCFLPFSILVSSLTLITCKLFYLEMKKTVEIVRDVGKICCRSEENSRNYP